MASRKRTTRVKPKRSGRAAGVMRTQRRAAARSQPLGTPPRRTRPIDEVLHLASGTAVALEALRTGLPPQGSIRRRVAIPHEDERIRVGDLDDDALENEYVGSDTPGGSSPTPDQNDIDDIGRAYGLQEEGVGPLRTASEILNRRDRRRARLDPDPSR